MFDEAPAVLVASSTRLVLLSNSELLDGLLQQYFLGCPEWQVRLARSSTLRPGTVDADLVLLDVGSFTDEDCLRLLRQLRDTSTALVNVPADQARRLLVQHPWIKGVFYPNASRINFSRGVAVILEGGDWLPRALMEKLLGRYRQLTHASRAIDDLSVREKQILALAGKGLSNAEIAESLHLSTHTIKSHIHNALGKLGASNRAQGASLVLGHVGEAGI
ncbi:helix-turn-helix transcriptional regulator [Stutzerimonas xanthomarina]|uniref:DNA-binding response regulator, NarL/FixJ family, contains REC and HTH domains n=2 Tax=Stutzerimonas xanthomarina TaxID=271420 RepID=A0A1M5PNW1_9GAMM|nr:response regulator transcription factor [Stutzerimonas xanthomarina]MCP9338216.1 response regulator transcription factor [Stutzerimonas xanthomarina]SEH72859.1 DNA-binding response regulator, NarL/FixJ family, contains REC and HTH domains [Stutzerimonas xanthomarina]SHH03426.1 DNA-binding response regulator, NarL/FixJ family, contains REC and HTH domains [Stutzerimonas xanthomarina DSM 18231]